MHGSFAKWRSGLRGYSMQSKKLRDGFHAMRALRIFFKCANNDFRFHGVRINIPRFHIVHISEGRMREPFSTAQFLTDTTANILRKVVRIVLTLSERHLKHKQPLRGRFKPKCRKTQRNYFGRVYGIDNAPAVNGIASEPVRMPG